MPATQENPMITIELLEMTAMIVAGYVAKSNIAASEIPSIIKIVYDALLNVKNNAAAGPKEPEILKAAVPIRRSVTPEYIICLEDGKKLRMLKRHLRTSYGLSPEEYRARWGLPPDYPMVAPNYAKQRSDFAKKIGLGRGAPRKKPRSAAKR